ncbi:ROK family protein [Actinocorallia sp. A-T 12471]|uniref:ROK family protein n=1 Tax=Actinocorallia sp. A-T 12471 TaxID=3089813 RepID=UPI0029D32D24|nr:ROK family protein [Actinocorallia sp. A-T 12471]MDX6740596.1 ROK family protein [Actinocorallia sp. A-T 12471]
MTTEATGVGELLALLRDGQARTRSDLVKLTGMARSTVTARLDALLEQKWIVPSGESLSSGGRPAAAFAFNPTARVVLAADLGAMHARAAITDLSANILAQRRVEIAISEGPEKVLGWLVTAFEELLQEQGRTTGDVSGVGVGLPGPVAHESGRPVNPPIMPGWDDFDVPGWLSERLHVPVLVDNDVNIMALGEHWSTGQTIEHMLFVKIGTGIGSGIISGHRLHRGMQGAAGDIGHIRVRGEHSDAACRCGNVGCLEAVAGGAAIADRLRADGKDTRHAWDVVRLVRRGDQAALTLVRQAGRELGDVLASLVNFFNPTVIVIGGELVDAGEHLLAGVRERVYSRSLPLATAHLQIRASELGERVGVIGAAVMVIEETLTPERVGRTTLS